MPKSKVIQITPIFAAFHYPDDAMRQQRAHYGSGVPFIDGEPRP
jgi:hypothetical protein